jgi:branched-chain amino acid transport system substrate-binding protein
VTKLKLSGLFGCMVATLIAALVIAGCSKKPEEAPIKIGADITLTGQTAFWGQQVKKGLDVAVAEANEEQGARPVKVLYQDNQGEAKNGISIFQRFATIDRVSAVVSIFSPVSNPLRPLAVQSKVPLLATVVSAEGFGKENEWSFRDFPSQGQQANAIADYVYRELKLRRAVCLVVNDDYGRDGERVFTAAFEGLGGKVVGSETIKQTDSDARAQATKLMTLGPDCLFVVVRDTTLGLCVKQFRELGFKGRIVGVNAFDAPVVWKAAGDADEGVVFSSAYIDYAGNAAAKAFFLRYKAANAEDADWVAVYGYTIGKYLCQVVRQAGGDAEKVRLGLAALKAESIRGTLVMSPGRDVLGPIGIYERKGTANILQKRVD